MECSRVECNDERSTPLGIDTHSDVFTCRVCKKRRFPIRIGSITNRGTPCHNNGLVNSKHPDVCFFCFHQESMHSTYTFSCLYCITNGTFDDKGVFHICYSCSIFGITKEEREKNKKRFQYSLTEKELRSWLSKEEENVRYRDRIIQDTKREFLAIMNKDQIKMRCLVILVWTKSDQMKRLPKDVLKYLCRLEFPLCEN